MAALNAQTHAQFQQYAAQQHPGNGEQVCACAVAHFLLIGWPSDKSVLWSCSLGFDSESGQTNDFRIDMHSFPV